MQEQVTAINASLLPFTDSLLPDPFTNPGNAISQNPMAYMTGGRRLMHHTGLTIIAVA